MPNPECKEYSLSATLYNGAFKLNVLWPEGAPRQQWQLVPPSSAKVLPSYIPPQIVDDYNESCSIKALSPKASATLARRCLQGMIRDFWGISKNRLIDEIDALKDKIDPPTWDAIDSLRKIGNIGAHMERDINVIVDVGPDEAELLIQLIETLIDDWYVERYERDQRNKRFVQAALDKDLKRKAGPPVITAATNEGQEGTLGETNSPSVPGNESQAPRGDAVDLGE